MKRTFSTPISAAPTSRAYKPNRFLKLLSFILLTLIISACSTTTELAPQAPQVEEPTQPDVELASDFAEPTRRMFGAYTYSGVWSGMAPIYDLESIIGQRLDIVHWFMSWSNEWESDLVASAASAGRIPMITWEPNTKTIQEIANGDHDDYMRRFAADAKEYGEVVYLRPFPEMNGSWTKWNGDAETFVKAWKHMVDTFNEVEANNVKWVWAPNITDSPRIEGNRMEDYYPGEAYVDILALDGYNWGNTRDWSSWTSFEDIFKAPYERIAKLGEQPIWLAEVASAEQGGDKAEWISDMFATTGFPRLEALVWFNEDKEANWHIDSSADVVAAFQTALANDEQLAGVE